MIQDLKKVQYPKRTIIIIILILIGLFSRFLVAKLVTDPSFNAATIESLEEKKTTVLKLAATMTASSTALSLLPGDVALPIANQMAELNKYFIMVISAIILEKVLVSVVGHVTFSYIIPIACLLGIGYLYLKLDIIRNLAIKLAIFGIVIFAAIPVSIRISDLIYSTHQASLEQTVEIANENKEYIEEKKEEFAEEDKNWMERVGNYLSNFTSKIGLGMSEIVKKGEDTLNKYIDAIAVLIISTCVIPIIVLLFFAWIIKILFGFEIRLPKKKE
ncbi:MAG: beta-carotene 15,15'-monooxygenase [Tissierellia bacterium]|mgnify:CR=1 FL=1|nr:beta-carotene 15,15'-monooxygenase [Tissierellia bacterium]